MVGVEVEPCVPSRAAATLDEMNSSSGYYDEVAGLTSPVSKNLNEDGHGVEDLMTSN